MFMIDGEDIVVVQKNYKEVLKNIKSNLEYL